MHSLWIQRLREAEHHRYCREPTTDAVQPLLERFDRARPLANLQAEDGARAQLVRTEAIGVAGRGEARVRRRDRKDCERRRWSARERSRSRMPSACGHVVSGIRPGWRVAAVVSSFIRRTRSSGAAITKLGTAGQAIFGTSRSRSSRGPGSQPPRAPDGRWYRPRSGSSLRHALPAQHHAVVERESAPDSPPRPLVVNFHGMLNSQAVVRMAWWWPSSRAAC
jgi:hypothetical protein